MRKYEYIVEQQPQESGRNRGTLEAWLNEMGQKGWRLVHIDPFGRSWWMREIILPIYCS